ncbi:hypothetical protein JCM10212_005590 [Sporobolomyces blumeae]
MSYNGVGLSTPRGSGTSGHIQANRSSLRPRQQFDKPADFRDSFSHRAPDQGILDHERKRRVEAKCFELQVSLEDDGVAPDEIEAQVGALREKLLAEGGQREGAIKASERHELAQAKQIADEKFRKALGIKEGHVEGLAFDREAQAEIKRQKAEEREKAREERARIQADLEKARVKALKEREANQRKHEEEMAERRREHEDTLRRERREHEARMADDRRRMDDELEARRRGAPPTAATRGGEGTSLPTLAFSVAFPLALAFPVSVPHPEPFLLEVAVAESQSVPAEATSAARQPESGQEKRKSAAAQETGRQRHVPLIAN